MTSHSNIGGGLNPLNATSGRDLSIVESNAINVLNKFGTVTVNSQALKLFLNGKLESPIVYLPNGVDHTFFKPHIQKFFSPDKIKIGWVGKKRGAKNYELVEEFKNKLSSQFPQIEFREIVLDKNLEEVPYTENEMKKFYQDLDFFLITSWHEGTPNPGLEAAACGVPLISTRVGNMIDLIEDKKNSYFIDPQVDSLNLVIKDILSLSNESYLKMREEIRKSIEFHWTWDKNKQGLLKVLE